MAKRSRRKTSLGYAISLVAGAGAFGLGHSAIFNHDGISSFNRIVYSGLLCLGGIIGTAIILLFLQYIILPRLTDMM